MMSHAYKVVLAAALLALPQASHAAPSKLTSAAPAEKAHSAFIIPKAPADGRDPFFPKATSLYQTANPARPVVVESGINLLKVNGVLGTSLATINGVTLSVGETEEVKTTSGGVSVRLVEIRTADGTVTVEANGQRRALPLPK